MKTRIQLGGMWRVWIVAVVIWGGVAWGRVDMDPRGRIMMWFIVSLAVLVSGFTIRWIYRGYRDITFVGPAKENSFTALFKKAGTRAPGIHPPS